MRAQAVSRREASQVPPVPVRRFTVEEYHRLGEAGVLTEDDRVELLEGWIVTKMIHKPRHDATVNNTADVIREKLPKGWSIRVQSSITTSDSEPEPDIAVVLGPARRYAARHPAPGDVALVIEVAETSLVHDRSVKSRLYAQAGIPQYWVINLIDNVIETYSDPSEDPSRAGYRRKKVYRLRQSIPLKIRGRELGNIPVKDLLDLQ